MRNDPVKHPSTDLPDFDALWNYNDPAGTAEKFQEILPNARQAGDRSYLAQLLTQIARTQGLQREFGAAHKTLDEADGLIDAAMPVARIRYLLERGRVFNSSKQQAKARPLFLQAWELAREQNQDFYAVDAAHMLAIVDKGDPSLAWNEKAIKLAEQSADAKANGWLGSLYNNTGWTYHDMGRFQDALACFEKNLAWQTERGKQEKIGVAKWSIARTLRSLGRVEEALTRQQELLEEHQAAGTSDGYVHEELGECLLLLDRTAESRPHFARAHELLSKDPWLTANESERLERLRKLADDKP